MKEASRAQCIKMLWKYLKDHNLQDPEKTILLPRQKDGQDLWTRKDSCIWNGQVFGCPLDSNLNFCQRLRRSTRIFTGQRHINHQKLQIEKKPGNLEIATGNILK